MNLTDAQRAVMASYGQELEAATRQVRILVDAAHEDGLAIPPSIAPAAHALAALGLAWSTNAAGRAVPPEVRAALGLPPVLHDPAQLTIGDIAP